MTQDEWKTLWLKKHRRQIKSGQMSADPTPKATVYKRSHSMDRHAGWIFRDVKEMESSGQITLGEGGLELACFR